MGGLVAVVYMLTLGMISLAEASDNIAFAEFDSRMLWGSPDNRSSADLTRFAEGNPVPAGNMNVDLYLNGILQKNTEIFFAPVAGKSSAVACFTPADLLFFTIAVEKLPEDNAQWLLNNKIKSDCRVASNVVPGAEAVFDFSEQRLDLSIPQAYLLELPSDYIDPKQWDRGIRAGRLNYSVDMFNATSGGRSATQGFASLESGFNVLGWRLRNISSITSDRQNTGFQAQRTYAQTDIESLNSTLTVGQNYTDGQMFNAYGLQGAFLSTDVRMLPLSLRSYAPVVTGVADSNAKVTIRQSNMVIYERVIPPGPFEIKNFQAFGYGNDLEVTVTEADGSAKKFSVPYSPSVQLLPPGQSTYSASVGEAWSPSNIDKKPTVGQLSYQYGINNYLTAFGGAVVSNDYTALVLGSAVSTYIGGVSADYTYANSQFSSGEAAKGDSSRLIYSTLIESTNTNFTLSSYRYSSQGFWSFNEFINNESARSNKSGRGYYSGDFFRARQKGRVDISVRQRLAPGYGNFSVSGSRRNFWNREGADTQYQFSYNNRFRDISYDLSASRITNQDNRHYNEYRLTFSMPIFSSDSGSRHYLSAGASKHTEYASQSQAQLGGVFGSEQQFTYGLSTTQGLDSRNTQQSYGLSGGYQGAKASVTGSVSTAEDYRQMSLGMSGSMLLHSAGITFGQTLGETVALVEAKDAEGAHITNSSGAALDSAGFGIVPFLSAYSRNRIELDPEGIPNEVELESTAFESIPVAGSIVKVSFATSKESTIVIKGRLEGGAVLPFGAEVLNNATQKLVGYVGQAGVVFARGVGDQGRLLIKLKERNCLMDYQRDQPSVFPSDAAVQRLNSSVYAVCKF